MFPHFFSSPGRHCCLYCEMPKKDFADPPMTVPRQRSLQTLKESLSHFKTCGIPKESVNVIRDPFFDIPINRVRHLRKKNLISIAKFLINSQDIPPPGVGWVLNRICILPQTFMLTRLLATLNRSGRQTFRIFRSFIMMAMKIVIDTSDIISPFLLFIRSVLLGSTSP